METTQLETLAMQRKGWFRRVWGWVEATRRTVLNLIFLTLLVLLAVALWMGSGTTKLEEKTALVLTISGPIVEQKSGSLRDRISQQVEGGESPQTQLRDLITALDAAAKDPKIDRVVLLLDDMQGAGLSTLREVAVALVKFKASGKQLVAWGSSYNQRQYYLAAQANEVFMHPMGMAVLEGYGRYRNYYKDALDRLGVSANVIRVGTYKNAAEPYFANSPSPATQESDAYLYDALWALYTEGVEQARKLPVGSINQSIQALPERFAAVNGNAAQLALKEKLVDALKTRDELRTLLTERGALDTEKKTFRQIGMADYLALQKRQRTGDAIGIVVAEGEISEGTASAGKIGGKSTAELIRKARDDEAIKALVLRVRSPGGSAFGSELIRRELELTRAAGKPVIVSMGDVAASGGYWISLAADEIIADAATITGSIGVFAMLPTADKLLDKLPLHTGGYGTTWLTNVYDPRLALDPRFAALVQASVGNIYADFTAKAATARKTTPEKIDAVAQGRVWTGAQARDRGLVDRLGSLDDAIKAASTKAKLPDTARVSYLERDSNQFAQWLDRLGLGALADSASLVADRIAARIEATIGAHVQATALPVLAPVALPAAALAHAREELDFLKDMAQRSASSMPFMAVAHCLCDRY